MRTATNRAVRLVWTAVLVLSPSLAFAAGLGVDGTYQTPTTTGAFRFRAERAVVQWRGYEGYYTIGGKRYLEALYPIAGTTDYGMTWGYGSTGIPAGSARVSPLGGTKYTGRIEFTDRKGRVTDSGSLTVDIGPR